MEEFFLYKKISSSASAGNSSFKIVKNDPKPDFKKLMGGNSLSYGWKKRSGLAWKVTDNVGN